MLRQVRQNEDRSRARGSDTERQQSLGYDRLDGGYWGSILNERQYCDGAAAVQQRSTFTASIAYLLPSPQCHC